MKVALVHDFLNQWGGAERVLNALHELYPEAPVYTLMYDEEGTKGHFEGWKIISTLKGSTARRWRKFLLPFYPMLIEKFDLSNFDLVISSANSFAKGVLTRPETLHICYCHTPTAYLWSYAHQYLAEQRLGGLTGAATRWMLHRQRMWDRVAAERVDVWVANSKNVQERIKKFYRKDSTVIYPPVDTNRFSVSRQHDNYFLYASRLSGYKNPSLVIETFNRLKLPLIIVGTGDELPRLQQMAATNITFTGWLPDEDVAKYMSRCQALIFPVEEDFGIVPVEAMAAGRPVIALARGGAVETVISGKTGLLFDAATVESLTAAVQQFERQAGKFDPKLIRRHAEGFDRSVFTSRMKRFVEQSWQDFTRKRPAKN